jgi:hypothetical protein
LLENEALDVVNEIGQPDLGCRTCKTDGSDEQAHSVLLLGEHMLDAGADLRFGGVGQLYCLRHERGEETGLSNEEIAFYDALAENQSAREVMGEPKLRVIAQELVMSIKGSVTVDWMHRDAARARMRVLVKRILRKYGYPPDLQDAAVQTVLQQAEALSAEWAQV